MMILEIQQFLWVNTPHGDGQALFLMDYGPHENTIWVVALEKTGAIKHYNSNQVKLCINNTFNINIKKNAGKSERTRKRYRDSKARGKAVARTV